ncbi:hydroxyproline-rich glycoprotein family protein [Melia azedarach]|uniref:Hydroxyproline-rich glycoprotein family protein n=1 Tax=Melia azedarach TaxID=155640 RepID=A0ACC1XUM4_MELAZ|nr:hydroxyproline-rich glycoprotein family protein [Melia azedarach]
MESPDFSPPHGDASRPSLGFPLGTALLLIVIFSLSGIFSCCYHWDKLRSLRQSFSEDADPEADNEGSPSKSKPAHTDLKKNQSQSLPVLMPGDQIPKFIALPCPCEPPRAETIVVKVQKPPKLPRLPVPLY